MIPETIAEVLQNAMQALAATTDVPQLEAEVLLSSVLQVSRDYLYTWPEKPVAEMAKKSFFELVQRRTQHEPIAYITGSREFWSLDFVVTKDVLIPRPETELLVELLLKKITQDQAIIADLGTGCGTVALALAHEKPHWQIYATDASAPALAVATLNAKRFDIKNVQFQQGEWCAALPSLKCNAIVSNPPYLAKDELLTCSKGLNFEPASALIADEEGFGDIRRIIFEAKNYLLPGGMLLLEHGFRQAKKITGILEEAGYTDINTYPDLAGLNRVTIASWVHF